ncbi:MAG: glycosyltransferase family 2 protein [Acidobacteriaceae bacterium]|nr:glycosyltransferase family 2 protein [Acidobacteriaceae bacterium]
MLKLLTEVELTKRPGTLFVDPQYGRVWVLVTWEGAPLCTFELDCDPGARTISGERLHKEALERSAWLIWQKKVERSFDKALVSLPPISVVVCTRDRANLLERSLESLRHLDYPEYEVVVVDNCSRDPEVARVIDRAGFRYIREERPGLDWARNRGIAAARYNIIAFIDDDAIASPMWLRGIARGFQHLEVMVVTGQILPAELDTEAQLLFEWYGGMSKGMKAWSFNAAALHPQRLFAAHDFGVGANMAFRRQVLERVGMFDTMLDAGTPSSGAGDLDMFHRVLAAGLTIRYEPEALVRHRHRRSYAGLRRQLRDNGKSYGVFLIKAWRAGRKPGAANYAARWFFGWVMRRLFRSFIGRESFPRDLLWAEFRGAVQSPWAYLATIKNDRRIRDSHPSVTEGI